MRWERCCFRPIGIVDNDVVRMYFADALHIALVEGYQVQLVKYLQMSRRLSPFGFVRVNLRL